MLVVNGAVVADLMVFATAAGALTFVVAYAWLTRGHWRDTVVGRHVMTFMSVILLVSILAVIGAIFGREWPYRDVIRGVVWAVVAGCMWWWVFLLLDAQRPGRRRPPVERPDEGAENPSSEE